MEFIIFIVLLATLAAGTVATKTIMVLKSILRQKMIAAEQMARIKKQIVMIDLKGYEYDPSINAAKGYITP